MSTNLKATINLQETFEEIMDELRSVTTGEHYNNARAKLYVALNTAKKVPELQDLMSHIEVLRDTTNKTFVGDVTRYLLIDELRIFLQEVQMKAED